MPTFISVAENSHILDANEAFTFTTGYGLAEVIGRSAAELQLWDGAAAQRMLDAPPSNRFSGACLFAAGAAIREKRKVFFSEEKKQKTFMALSRFYPASPVQVIKVFWFFFSKKNSLSSLPLRWGSDYTD